MINHSRERQWIVIAVALLIACLACAVAFMKGGSTESSTNAGFDYEGMQETIVQVSSGGERGSGVWVSDDEILTAQHFIKDPENVRVYLRGGESGTGKVVLSPSKSDLAKVKVEGLKALRVADQAESSAGKVVAMGHPYGMLPLMMSEGLTTGRKETTQMPGSPIKGSEWVLFTAAINPGMSGGGVFNEQGKLVGLISWRADTMNSRDVQQMSYYTPVR